MIPWQEQSSDSFLCKIAGHIVSGISVALDKGMIKETDLDKELRVCFI